MSDRRLGVDINADGYVDYYKADLTSSNDYYPFGSNLPGRSYNPSAGYRYGYNGKEKDPEGMGGGGSTYDYGFRIYNPQIGKFLSVDPLTKEYPELTPYQFASNRPIDGIDQDGLEYSSSRTGQSGPYRLEVVNSDNVFSFTPSAKPENEAPQPPSSTDIALAGVGTAAEIGQSMSNKITSSRSGYSSGKVNPNSPKIYSKSTAKKVGLTAKGIGWGLTLWSVWNTESQFDKKEITPERRWYNHLNNGVGIVFPVTAIPAAIGDYYGQTNSQEINNSVTQSGGFLHDATKLLLKAVNIPTENPKVENGDNGNTNGGNADSGNTNGGNANTRTSGDVE